MSAKYEIHYLGDVQRLALQPDDVVVITTTEPYLTSGDAKRVKDIAQAELKRTVIVLPQGWTVGVLARESVAALAEDHTASSKLQSVLDRT